LRLPKGFKKALKKSKELQLKVYDTVLGDKILSMPLEDQVNLARKLSIGPMPAVRANLLKQLPHDVNRYATQGMSGDQIKIMYWDCKPFREWWELLQLDEANLGFVISNALKADETIGVVS